MTETARACLTAALSAGLLSACGVDGGDSPPEFSVTMLEFPGSAGSAQAHLAPIPAGGPVLSWLEPAGDRRRLQFSRFDGSGFAEPRTVASSERFFVNWADFPSVVPISETHWVAHWLERQRESFGAYDAVVAVSADAGETWSTGIRLNEDATRAEHGFVSVFAWNGDVNAFWLDGRELANWSFDEPDALLAVSLRVAKIAPDGSITDRKIVDPMVCDCCQPDVAVASAGPVVAYRDRTEGEIRDVVVRTYRGGSWRPAAGIGNEGWFIEGCPVNGPSIAANGNAVAVAWFTAADEDPRVRIARSQDGGETFGSAIDLDSDGAYGQVDVVVDADGSSVVSWWRRGSDGGIDLALRSVGADGTLGPVRIVATESVSRPVDVPQMLTAGDRLLLAWTTFDEAGSVRAALASRP